MASQTEISNMALSHLGSAKEIASMNERSQEASACNRFYDTALDATLRDCDWPFAAKIAALGLIEESPNSEWDYSYRYPSDCLDIQRVLSGLRNDTRQTRVPYKIAQDDAGRIIYTDQIDAEIEYTVRETDPLLYPPDFVLAFSLRLAVYIAPRVTGGDPFKMGERAMRMYLVEIGIAKASSLNELQDEELPESEFIRERG